MVLPVGESADQNVHHLNSMSIKESTTQTVRLVTKADESAYREEVERVVDWCSNNDPEA